MTTAVLLLLLAQDPFARSGIGAVRLGATAYVVGGMGIYQEDVPALLGYDLKSAKWSSLAYLPERVYFPACTAAGGRLLVFGGLHRDGTACNHVRMYDPAEDKWSDLPTMPTARSRATATFVEGKVFVIGGIEGGDQNAKNSNKVEVYDVRTKGWSRIAPLAQARHGHCAELVGGKLVVAGGYAGDKQMEQSASVEVWTQATGWKKGADLPEPRGFAQSVAYDGAMWLFGNRGGANHPVHYDPAADKWLGARVEVTNRHRGAAVEYQGKLYLLFGEDLLGRPIILFNLARQAWVGPAR